MIARAAFVACILLCVCATVAGDEGRPRITPKQLLVGTVIDTTSAEIVRDAMNMIKSIRVFGESFNGATILVGITGELNAEDDSVLHTLTDLDVQIMFIPQSPPGHAKTLNKFRIFEAFDSIKFDYFLWLDADVFAFQDPMPYLHMHTYPGSIECVPDFYSYMRRYPSVNTSVDYWNPEKLSFYLLGEGETAPHGICNTGVLYFDSLSLSKFTAGLSTVLQNETYMDKHGKDRFIDSLIFTKVVNTQGLEVTTLPHSLNYMALFEIEIQEELTDPQIVMAHLLSDTELYCTATAPAESNVASNSVAESAASGGAGGEDISEKSDAPGCSCVYRNKLLPPKDSLLRDTIQDKILSNVEVCHIFAGVKLPPHWPGKKGEMRHSLHDEFVVETANQGSSNVDVSAEGDSSGGPDRCELVTPPASGAILRVHSDRLASLPVMIHCADPPDDVPDPPSPRSRYVRSNITDPTTGAVVHSSYFIMMQGALWPARIDLGTLRFHAVAPTQGGAYTAYFTLSTMVEGVGSYTANLTVVFDHLIPPGQVHYSANPLLSTKPAALESQLYLPYYLNDRHMRGTGVAVCCYTHKGVAAVRELIERWEGQFLLIVLESTPEIESAVLPFAANPPAATRTESLHQLRAKLTDRCAETNKVRSQPLVCYITVAGGASQEGAYALRIAHSLRPRSAQFVYLDHHAAYADQSWLPAWLSILTKGGLLMGTQYFPPAHTAWKDRGGRRNGWAPITGHGQGASSTTFEDTETQAAWHRLAVRLTHNTYAAQTLALAQAQSLLATYSEREPSYCDAYAASHAVEPTASPDNVQSESHGAYSEWLWDDAVRRWECAPAWYMHKLRQ